MDREFLKSHNRKMQAAVGGAGAEAPAAKPYSVVASGSYGTVVSPALPNLEGAVNKEFPGNVTKIFYRKSNLNTTLDKAREIVNLMNSPFPNPANKSHNVYPYSKLYTFNNLPNSLKPGVEADFRDRKIPIAGPLQLLRMPNLGIDIFGLRENRQARLSLRNVPFLQLFYQFIKVFIQTDSLVRHGYIHYDIRDTNVMIKPNTGEINIIDFDLMKTFDQYHSEFQRGTGVKYQHPPECLMYHNMDLVENPSDAHNIIELIRTDAHSRATHTFSDKRVVYFREYREHALTYFDKVFEQQGVMDIATMDKHIVSANVKNVLYIRSLIDSGERDIYRNHVLKTIDNFGLGLTLLQVLGLLYPSVVQYGYELVVTQPLLSEDDFRRGTIKRINRLKPQLAPVVTNNGSPYSDNQLYIITSMLIHLSILLNQACSFELQSRPSSMDIIMTLTDIFKESVPLFMNEEDARAAIDNINSILATVYPEAAEGVDKEAAEGGAVGGAGAAPAAAPAAVPAEVPANQGGGGRRTRSGPNRKGKRKFNTRNKRRCARKH